MRSTSCGSGVPTVSMSPTSMWSPSATSRRDRLDTGYSRTSEPSSGVTMTLRVLSVSSISTRPAASEIGERPLGMRASKISWTRGRPCVMSSAEATPPVWKVRIVSWVPGSPIDCAAMMPTASQLCAVFAGHIERPALLAHAGRRLALEYGANRDGRDLALLGLGGERLDQFGQLATIDLDTLLN